MDWEKLTSPLFWSAVKESQGLCILPLGVLERHGDHLPLGTDSLIVESIVRLAADEEPVVVFPVHHYTQIFEARHCPGTIAIDSSILVGLLLNLCDEIARNGFTKVYLVNGHGGNIALLQYFLFCALEKKRDYAIYCSSYGFDTLDPEIKKIIRTSSDLHAGEMETSLMMALYPGLVREEKIPDKPGDALGRLILPRGVSTPVSWYANYPNHYSGDARLATKEKGEEILALCTNYVVSAIRAIKNDSVAPGLMREFYKDAFPGAEK